MLVTVLLSGCAVVRAEHVSKLALLAPFEGRFREVGYTALYAARLALADSGLTGVELLAVDDGGAEETAADRAQALFNDPVVRAVLVLGYAASSEMAQKAYGDVPAVIVGYWTEAQAGDRVLILANRGLAGEMTISPTIDIAEAAQTAAPVIGGEVFALAQFSLLRPNLEGIAVVSSGSLPADDFSARYAASDPFAPPPGLLATLVYDAVGMATQAIAGGASRADVYGTLSTMDYSGINGDFRFQEGAWANAPIHTYVYDPQGHLALRDDVVK